MIKAKSLKVFIAIAAIVCMIVAISEVSFAQGIYGKIKGKVVEQGTAMPLIGTNVSLLGTTLGAATDRDGVFEIRSVPPGTYTILVRFMGYKSIKQEVTVGASQEAVANFELKVDVLQLDEIVVTGMGGTLTKEKLGVTIAKVRTSDLVNSDENNIVAAMAGKASNVEITSFSGEPGATQFIQIRGRNTIAGSREPLFIVDGVPIDNSTRGLGAGGSGSGGTVATNRGSDLNPEDIASMEILKGASASAIYGSRAANGVILITTKSGKPGRTNISYKTSYSWDEVNRIVPLQTEYGQGDNGVYKKDYLRSWGPKLDASTPTYDHSMEMWDQTGHIMDNNLTISGGNNLTTFYASLGLINQDGPFVGNSDKYKKYSFRIKGSHVVSDKLKVTGNLAYAKVNADYLNSRSNSGGITLAVWRTPPDFNNLPYLDPETGLHRSFRYSTPTELRASRKYDNPFFTAYEKINDSEVGRTYGNLTLEYDPVDWIGVNYTLGSDYSEEDKTRVRPVSSLANSGNGSMWLRNYNYHEIDNNLITTFKLEKYIKKLNKNFSGTFMAGYNFNRREYKYLSSYGDNFVAPNYYQMDNCVTTNSTEYEYLIHTESFFGQATLDIYDQLFLTAALRNDGSSTFGKNERRHWFPKFSTAWEFTKFGKMPKIPYFNYGKLHFAYGEAGSQPGVYSTMTGFLSGNISGWWTGTLNAGSYDGVGGFYSSSIAPATDLRPERTKEYEIGVNLGFWDSRIGFDLTYYKSRTEDVIFGIGVPPSTGYSVKTTNGAVIENKGWEIDFNINPIKTKNFSWDLGMVWATNENKCVDLMGAEMYSYFDWSMISSVAAEGYPIGQFYGRDYLRFGNGSTFTLKDGTTINIDEAYPNAPAGEAFIDEDGYPTLDPQFRFLRDPNPDWTAGIRNEFTLFGKIKLSSFIDIKQGNYVWNGSKAQLINFGTHEETLKRGTTKVFDGYGPGAGNDVELDQNWYKGVGSGATSQFIEDGSYVRLREIAISYTLRHKIVHYFGLSDINIRLSGRNLMLWTDYSGIDPETNINNTGVMGMDYFNMPNTKSYVLTLRFNY